jgi:hypothetical protein
MKRLYPILIICLLFAVKSEKIEYNLRYLTNYKEYSAYYNSRVNLLSAKHSGKLFSLTNVNYQTTLFTSLLNKNIIVDTSVVGHYTKNGRYFIRTTSRSTNNLLCELNCEKSLYEEISRSNNPHYLLAVKVNSVESHQRIVELDSIDNKSLFVKNGNDVVLYGECLDAVELPNTMIF